MTTRRQQLTDKKIGRNDPCWCGSGKKYKHCHMRHDEREQHASLDTTEPEASSGTITPARVMQTRDLARQLLPQASPDKQQEIHRLLTEMDEAIEFEDKRSQIEVASQALEAHRAEFEALLKDWQAVADRSHALFAEEPFAPMWFTVEDIVSSQ